ncbi:hypothetical protein Tco_0800351 [Tanacetum coccineum]|uniref:Synaptobrevin, longin-like domain protein n=1 Tax=Tanacetum coccineum TaxID=301880 RepID=A0ABQ4ZXB4_9ASTR
MEGRGGGEGVEDGVGKGMWGGRGRRAGRKREEVVEEGGEWWGHIKYALTENPPIYKSFIKHFWQTTSASTLEDGEVGITATIDGQLKTLALMGYVSNTDKLTFQKGHFSPQWRFLIHTILHYLSPKKTAWEQFSSNIATAIICLATNRTFKFSKMIFDAMVKNLDSLHKFLMYPRFIQIILNKQKRLLQPHTRHYITPTLTQKLFGNIKSASKGYTRVDIPLFPTMLIQGLILQCEGSTVLVKSHHTPSDEAASTRVDVRLGGAVTTISSLDAGQGSGNINKTPSMPHDSPLPGGHTPGSDEGRMQQKELMDLVTKLSDRVKKLEKIVKSNKARRRAKFIVSDDEEDLEDSSKQGRRIADIDQDSDISLVHHDANIQGRYEDISIAEFNINTAKPVSIAGAAVTTASKGKMVESEKPSKKKDQVKADEELAKRLEEEMQAELEEEARIKRIAQEEAFIAVLIA